jgi:hypothetical protein
MILKAPQQFMWDLFSEILTTGNSPTIPWSALQLLPSSATCMFFLCSQIEEWNIMSLNRGPLDPRPDLTSLHCCDPEMENWNYDNCCCILQCVLLSLPAFELGVTKAPEVLKWRPHRWGYPVSTRHHWRLWTKGITSCDRIGQWTQVNIRLWYQE